MLNYTLPQKSLFPYSLLKVERFLSSSTHLISTFSSKTTLISDTKNIVEIFRCSINQNKRMKIYNQNEYFFKIHQKQVMVVKK